MSLIYLHLFIFFPLDFENLAVPFFGFHMSTPLTLTTLLNERTIPFSIKASMHTVKNIDKNRQSREVSEPDIGRPVERAKQEHIEENGDRGNPWHEWYTPEFRLACLRDHAVKNVQYGNGKNTTCNEQCQFCPSRRYNLPNEGEHEGTEGQSTEEGHCRPRIGCARNNISSIDHSICHHVKNKECSNGHQVEKYIEISEKGDGSC